ncbi:MAG: membrane protein insertase YidC, partial [Parachlamydiaceae bacterium]
MDKRLFIYILSMGLAIFFMNNYFSSDHEEQLRKWQAQQKIKEEAQAKLDSEKAAESGVTEKFYVLENSYQQLVFSNKGGALAEINLPFTSETNTKSVVKEIEFDRDMVEKHPQNAKFPAHPYLSSESKELKEGMLGGYYPLIRRELVQEKPRKSVSIPPRFYALNIVSEYPEVAELVYDVTHFDNKSIVFEAKQGHRKITKTFNIADEETGGAYCFDLTVKIEGESQGLWLTSGVPEVEWISGGPAPALKYRTTRNQKPEVRALDLPQESATISEANPDWLCNSNGFFGTIMDPLGNQEGGIRYSFIKGTEVPSRLVEIDQEYDLYQADKMPGYQTYLPLKPKTSVQNFRVFAGPFSTEVLKTVDATYSKHETGYNPDYIACQTFHGWFAFISEPFAKFLLFLMRNFYWVTGSWALSIFLLTVALRIMLYPLNAWSFKSTMAMQEIAPQVKAIQDKYKKEPQKAQVEIVNLYREKGVNPLSGCLPLLIQMPFLIGMFDLLKSTFEL